MTLGLDRSWRTISANQCPQKSVIADICCGTGDFTFSLSKMLPPTTRLIGIDFDRAMLQNANQKKRNMRLKLGSSLKRKSSLRRTATYPDFVLADISKIPLRDSSVDCAGLAFALRNLTYENPKAKDHLQQIIRILKKGSLFICVETSQPPNTAFRMLVHIYLTKIVPTLGWLIGKSKGAYEYFGNSATDFFQADTLAQILVKIGFRQSSFIHMTFGAVALHVSVK